MDKVAPGTAFLLKVAANIADLNRGQFIESPPIAESWNYPKSH